MVHPGICASANAGILRVPLRMTGSINTVTDQSLQLESHPSGAWVDTRWRFGSGHILDSLGGHLRGGSGCEEEIAGDDGVRGEGGQAVDAVHHL